MTIRLLRPFNGIPANSIVELDRATEAALVSQLAATLSLSGGLPYVQNAPLDSSPAQTTGLQLFGSAAEITGQLQAALSNGGQIEITRPGIYSVTADAFFYPPNTSLRLAPGVLFSINGIVQGLSSLAPITESTYVTRSSKRPNSVVLVGDSITANDLGTTASSSYYNTIGCFAWANAYMNQRLEMVANLGVGGMTAGAYTTNSLRTNITGYLAAFPSAYVACLIGTNDITGNRTSSQLIADLDYIFKVCADANRVVLASTILPRLSGGSGLTTAQRNVLMSVNAWIRERNMRTDGVLVSDPFRYAADPASANSDPFANETYDASTVGLHPAPAMAMRVGKIWAADWGPFIPLTRRLVGGAGDTFDATNNQFGNLASNGTLQTLGATAGTGFTGNNPTGYTIQRVTGAGTWTGSAVARTDGVPGNWYQAAITLESNANAQYQMRQNIFGPQGGGTNTYAIGDQLFAEAELSIIHTGSTNYVRSVHVTATEYDRDGNVVFVAGSPYRWGGTNPLQRAEDYSIVARTPTWTTIGSAGSGGASQRVTLSVDVLFDGSVSAGLTIRMGQVSLRKVVS